MKTPRKNAFTKSNGGNFVHYGLEIGLVETVNRYQRPTYPKLVKVNIDIDGLPISRSSTSLLWQILASTVEDFYTEPFIVSAFHGHNKPLNSNDFLEPFVNETKEILKTGLLINGNKAEIMINAIICDAPPK